MLALTAWVAWKRSLIKTSRTLLIFFIANIYVIIYVVRVHFKALIVYKLSRERAWTEDFSIPYNALY